MSWNFQEALDYYRSQGAPSDQLALRNLLQELQQEHGGSIPQCLISQAARFYHIKDSYLLAIIKRIPSLRLADTHVLELCAGPNCPRRADLAGFVEKTYGKNPAGFTVRYTGCMHMCGQGPNLRWDGEVYNGATEDLIRSLVEKNSKV